MDHKSFTIGCLSITAVILLAAVFVISAVETQRAEASGMIWNSGNYTVLTGYLNSSSQAVYLIDSKTDKLLAYRFDESTHKINRTQVLDLAGGPNTKPGKPGLKP